MKRPRPPLLVWLLQVILLPIVWMPADAGPVDTPRSDQRQRAIAHRADARTVPIPSGLAPRLTVHRIGLPAGEPTLGVARRGNIFYTALQDSTRVEVVRSTDDGASWDVVSPKLPNGQNSHLLSFDPYLYVDEATGRVFTVDLTMACSYLSLSDDRGKTWTTNPLACGRPVNDHQTLFAGPPASSPTPAYPNVVYYCYQDVAASSCSKSLDGGLTFVPAGAPAFGPGAESCFDGGLHGHGVVDSQGAIYLPKEHCDQPFLAISRDEGSTWTRVQVAENGAHQDPTVDVDSEGNVYYGWIGGDSLPYLAVSRDGGRTWGPPRMIAAPGVLRSNLLTLDAGAPGRIAFLYMGTQDRRAPTTWNGHMGITTNALARHPIFVSSRVNPEADPLKRGGCGPGRCGEEILDFLDIVIASDGTVWGSFVDACNVTCARSGFAIGREGLVAHLEGSLQLR